MSEKNNLPFISVAIPVYNGESSIKNTLESVLAQNYPHDRYEVVVVNNNSSDRTQQIVEELIRHNGSRIRLFLEKKQGISYTRNNSIRNSTGDIVAFIDDDCYADKNWLKEIAWTFIEFDADAVQGKIVLATPIPKDIWFGEDFIQKRMAGVNYGDKAFVMKDEDLVGANMSFKKNVLERLGGMSILPDYILCEDTEFSLRLERNGCKRVYNPNVIVRHHYDISRLNEQDFLRQSFCWGKANVLLEPQPLSPGRYFLYCCKEIVVQYVNMLGKYFKKQKKEAFVIKCKLYGHLGRCQQIVKQMISPVKYE